MSEYGGLRGIWEDFNSYLDVNIDVDHDETQEEIPVLVKFTVANTGQAQEDRPEIIYDEVVLRISVPPDTWEKKVENLAGDQSFEYELRCSYDSIMQMEWSIQGKVSPSSLLQFQRKTEGIKSNGQFPIKTYFGFLEQINVHQWLKGPLQSISIPGPDTTLGEMKQKEESLGTIVGEVNNAIKRIQDFLSFVNYKNNRDDVLRHRNAVVEYLQFSTKKISELRQQLRDNKIDVFSKSREITIEELTKKADSLDEATKNLAEKLGIVEPEQKEVEIDSTSTKLKTPPPIALREIDLHGNTAERALPIVDKFLNDSFMENVRRVRIIHGKGIFILQKAIREYLEAHKLIIAESISAADKDHGGEGATEADLVESVPPDTNDDINDTDEDW